MSYVRALTICLLLVYLGVLQDVTALIWIKQLALRGLATERKGKSKKMAPSV